jgi:HPt (histidine-containing phosphotransfer) domain-containing protein
MKKCAWHPKASETSSLIQTLPTQPAGRPHGCDREVAFRGMLLHKFAARGPDQVAALERALGAGNAVELARQAQAVKNVAAHLADDALHARADELQRTAERGDLAGAGLALVRTREEIARSVETAIELLSQLSAEAASETQASS